MIRALSYLRTLIYHINHFGPDAIQFLYNKWRKKELLQLKLRGFDHPIYMRNQTTDIPMFYHIYLNREYDFNLEKSPDVIVDLGAHTGLSATFFANKYPAARIIAVEAEKSNFEILLKNTSFYKNITCINKAIWNEPTNINIVDKELGNWGYMTEEAKEPGTGSMQAISMDQLVEEFDISSIDLCKINIEGSEKELFEKNYEKWLQITEVITIELHDHMRPGCTRSFFNALQKSDFSLSWRGAYLIVHFRKQ